MPNGPAEQESGGEDGPGASPSAAGPEAGVPSVGGNKVSGLRLEHFAGSRNPTVYRDWKRQVRAVQLCSDLPKGRLAVLANDMGIPSTANCHPLATASGS